MKKRMVIFLCALLLMSACAPKEGIEVRDAWMNPASRGNNGAVYLIIHNYSDIDDALIKASTEMAETVELHRSNTVNDVVRMEVLPSVPLTAGEDVEFVPGELHITLINLKEALQIGDTVEIILHFQNHADIPVSAEVHTGTEHGDH